MASNSQKSGAKTASEGSGGGKEHGRQKLNCLRDFLNHAEQMLVEMQRLKVRTEEELRNMFLETRGKGILIKQWQKAQQNSVDGWEAELSEYIHPSLDLCGLFIPHVFFFQAEENHIKRVHQYGKKY